MPAQPSFRYSERRPTARLLPWIRNYWMLDVGPDAPPLHHVPPDGCTALVFRLTKSSDPEIIVSGPWLVPLSIPVRPDDRFGGIRLQPGAAPLLLGVSAAALTNRAQPAAPMLGVAADRFDDAVLGAEDVEALAVRLGPVLDQLVTASRHPDPIVTHVVNRLAVDGDLSPSTIAAELGVSDRTLRRRFGAGTGISPKQYARIRRFIRAAWGVADNTRTWSEVAHGVGYADQPHLNRDVTDLTGLTPGALRQRILSTRHDDVIP